VHLPIQRGQAPLSLELLKNPGCRLADQGAGCRQQRLCGQAQPVFLWLPGGEWGKKAGHTVKMYTPPASTTDNLGVASVAFYADDNLLGTDTNGADGCSHDVEV